MSKGTCPLKLPQSIKRAAERPAKNDGVSLNQWISVAVAQKVGVVETAAELLKRRAGNSRPEDLKQHRRTARPADTRRRNRSPDRRTDDRIWDVRSARLHAAFCLRTTHIGVQLRERNFDADFRHQ